MGGGAKVTITELRRGYNKGMSNWVFLIIVQEMYKFPESFLGQGGIAYMHVLFPSPPGHISYKSVYYQILIS